MIIYSKRILYIVLLFNKCIPDFLFIFLCNLVFSINNTHANVIIEIKEIIKCK